MKNPEATTETGGHLSTIEYKLRLLNLTTEELLKQMQEKIDNIYLDDSPSSSPRSPKFEKPATPTPKKTIVVELAAQIDIYERHISDLRDILRRLNTIV